MNAKTGTVADLSSREFTMMREALKSDMAKLGGLSLDEHATLKAVRAELHRRFQANERLIQDSGEPDVIR